MLCTIVIIVSAAVITYLLTLESGFIPGKAFMLITDVTFQTGNATIYVTNTARPFPTEEDWKVGISSVTVDGVMHACIPTS